MDRQYKDGWTDGWMEGLKVSSKDGELILMSQPAYKGNTTKTNYVTFKWHYLYLISKNIFAIIET